MTGENDVWMKILQTNSQQACLQYYLQLSLGQNESGIIYA